MASAQEEGAPRIFEGRDGNRLVADVWGDPASEPVLLLHGGGQTRHAWGRTARGLAEAGFYSIALDKRGHGDSDWAPDGDYAIATYAEDLRAVLRQLGRPAALVGASLGGLTGLLVVGEDGPGAASALVLVDVTPRMELDGVQKIIAFMSAHPEGFASVAEAADCVSKYLPHRPRPADTTGLAKNLRRGEDGRFRWHWDPQFLTGRRTPGSSDSWERMDRAARNLRVPTLLVRGRMSELVSEEHARSFLEMAPGAEYVDVKDAAHMVAGDRNDVFSHAVTEFLMRRILGVEADVSALP